MQKEEELPYIFTVNHDPEAIRIGIIYVSLSMVMIPFYCVFNWVSLISTSLQFGVTKHSSRGTLKMCSRVA